MHKTHYFCDPSLKKVLTHKNFSLSTTAITTPARLRRARGQGGCPRSPPPAHSSLQHPCWLLHHQKAEEPPPPRATALLARPSASAHMLLFFVVIEVVDARRTPEAAWRRSTALAPPGPAADHLRMACMIAGGHESRVGLRDKGQHHVARGRSERCESAAPNPRRARARTED